MKRLLALGLVVVLAGCAGAATVERIAVPSVAGPPSWLRSQVEVEPVIADFPPVVAFVEKEVYEQALTTALADSGMLATGAGRYLLSAIPRSIQYEDGLFDVLAAAVVDYELVDTTTDESVFEETIATSGSSDDAFAGMDRLQYAGERAVTANIQELIRQLAELQPQ